MRGGESYETEQLSVDFETKQQRVEIILSNRRLFFESNDKPTEQLRLKLQLSNVLIIFFCCSVSIPPTKNSTAWHLDDEFLTQINKKKKRNVYFSLLSSLICSHAEILRLH
jgi:hypothetical protein